MLKLVSDYDLLFRPQIKTEKSGLAMRDLKLHVRQECIHEIFITKITFSRQIWQTRKILVLENYRLYGMLLHEINRI